MDVDVNVWRLMADDQDLWKNHQSIRELKLPVFAPSKRLASHFATYVRKWARPNVRHEAVSFSLEFQGKHLVRINMTAKQIGPEIADLALHYDQVMIAP